MKRTLFFLFVLWGLCVPRADAMIFISEILADPPSGLTGDANQDGTGSTSQDEFVEILNSGVSEINLSGWTINDAVRTRHVFPNNTFLLPQAYLVVFGGGSPSLIGVDWQAASTGSLGLNNTGDSVILSDHLGNLIDQVNYGREAGNDQSLVRSPQIPGAEFFLHSEINGHQKALFSPGNGLAAQPSQTVPEPLSCVYFGLAGLFCFRKIRKGLNV